MPDMVITIPVNAYNEDRLNRLKTRVNAGRVSQGLVPYADYTVMSKQLLIEKLQELVGLEDEVASQRVKQAYLNASEAERAAACAALNMQP